MNSALDVRIATVLKKLFDEGALISRMCCKVRKKFRGEKLFRRLRQVILSVVSKTLTRYEVNYYSMYFVLIQITVSIKKLHQLNISEAIFIKQACQWDGTRILPALSIINRLQQFSEATAQLIVKVFQNGQCWLEMNIALAMVSRVWILTKSLNKSFSRSCQNCTPLLNQSKMSETQWLPNFELPECLNNNVLENSQR